MENRMKDQGMLSWSEIATENTEATISFYKNVFGYERSDMQMPNGGTYTLLKVPQHTHAVLGVFKSTANAAEVSKHFFTVDNVDEAEKRALTLGGSVVQSAVDMPPMCRIAVLKDDQGYVFAIISYFDDAIKDYDPAVDRAGRTQGVTGWFDILSQDVDKALIFYTGLFGYSPKEYPDAPQRYVMLESEHAKDGALGGIGQMTEQECQQFGPRYIKRFIAVDDLEKIKTAVKANGGNILVEKIDVPPTGFFCVFSDNNGDVLSAFQHTD